MHRTTKFVASLLMTVALAAPVATFAGGQVQDDRDRENRDRDNHERVYDRGHKDYHQWDDHEQESWRRFQEEKHRKEHDFKSASRKEQNEYWNWRHSHPD